MIDALYLEQGKYAMIQSGGVLVALRHGHSWRDLTGDKLVGALFSELHAAREELRKQRPAIGAVFDRDVWAALDVGEAK